MRKTSVYLSEELAQRLAWLSRQTGRSQAEVLREAIASFEPGMPGGRDFALSEGFDRIDDDPRPISEIPEAELLEGFGS